MYPLYSATILKIRNPKPQNDESAQAPEAPPAGPHPPHGQRHAVTGEAISVDEVAQIPQRQLPHRGNLHILGVRAAEVGVEAVEPIAAHMMIHRALADDKER